MSIQEQKITEAAIAANGVQSREIYFSKILR